VGNFRLRFWIRHGHPSWGNTGHPQIVKASRGKHRHPPVHLHYSQDLGGRADHERGDRWKEIL